jgi:hypothetical protein
MNINIGDTVELNGKEYKIVGTIKRSYLLERDGKQYKATADKIKKIQQVTSQRASTPTTSYLERRVAYSKIFKPDTKMPTNTEECLPFFEHLVCELSPENLACDGEASRSQVQAKLREIRGTWKELETIAGRRYSEQEIEESMMGGNNE